MTKRSLAQRTGSHLFLIVLLGTLAYSNSFGVPFVLDDLESIVRNDSIRDLRNFLPGGSGYEFHPRRSVVYFSLAVNYALGGYNVLGYHLINLLIHLGNALLFYALLRLFFRTPLLAESHLAPQASTLSLLAALVFLLHPIQTQAVTYTIQRLATLCTFFYLLALLLYISARLRQTASMAGYRDLRGGLLLAGAFCAALLAMFSKEIAFTLPLAALLIEAGFFQGPWRQRALQLAPLLTTLVVIPLNTLRPGHDLAGSFQSQTHATLPPLQYLLTQFRVLVTYLRLMVWPFGQNLDYDYPHFESFFAAPVLTSWLLLTALLALSLWLWTIAARKFPELRLAALGIVWFFLTIAIESGAVPLPDLIFEHRLYLPSIGLCIAVAVAAVLAWQSLTASRPGRLFFPVALVLVVILGVATWQRNRVWRSEVSLWQDVTRKSPEKVRPWYNLGTHLTDAGRPREGIPALQQAIDLDPRHADAWHNLGRAYLMNNQPADAVAPLRRAISLAPAMDNATVNLSAALIQAGRPEEAVELLQKTLHRFPDWAEARYNLGLAYAKTGNDGLARRELSALYRIGSPLARSLAQQLD